MALHVQEHVARLQQDNERLAAALRGVTGQAQAAEAHVLAVLRDKDAMRGALEARTRQAAQQMVRHSSMAAQQRAHQPACPGGCP